MKEIKPSVRKSKSLLYPQDFLKKQGELENMPWEVHFLGNQKCSLYIVHGKNDAPWHLKIRVQPKTRERYWTKDGFLI